MALRDTRKTPSTASARTAPRPRPPLRLVLPPWFTAVDPTGASAVTTGDSCRGTPSVERDQLHLEPVAILEVRDARTTRDGVRVGWQRRPPVLRGVVREGLERHVGREREREVVQAGTEPAVQHSGHHVG